LPAVQRAQIATDRSLGTQIRNPRGASAISVALLPLNNPERNGNPKACATAALPRIISNALRYGQQARVWVQSENELVEIVVDDTGPGIPLAAREDERPFRPAVTSADPASSRATCKADRCQRRV
jgi:hypothetical protein